eukprot:364370-Chlamydomonas_euryale.AAC.6
MGDAPSPASSSSSTTMLGVVRSLRFTLMVVWPLLRQWLSDNMSPINSLPAADGLYEHSHHSWWALRFSLDTPLRLSPDVQSALALLVRVAASARGGPPAMAHAQLWDLAVRCCWSVSAAHVEVASELVSLGIGELLTEVLADAGAPSELLCTCVAYVTHLVTSADEHIDALGGLKKVRGYKQAGGEGKGG